MAGAGDDPASAGSMLSAANISDERIVLQSDELHV